MDSFRYVNIFETKGLEYLLLITFLVLFVLFVRYLMRPSRPPRGAEPPRGAAAGARADREAP
jgi:hypothetical protein